jgi:hypothetical protein
MHFNGAVDDNDDDNEALEIYDDGSQLPDETPLPHDLLYRNSEWDIGSDQDGKDDFLRDQFGNRPSKSLVGLSNMSSMSTQAHSPAFPDQLPDFPRPLSRPLSRVSSFSSMASLPRRSSSVISRSRDSSVNTRSSSSASYSGQCIK